MTTHKHGAHDHSHHGKGGHKVNRSTHEHNGKHASGKAPGTMKRLTRPAGRLTAPKGGKSNKLAGVKI